MQEKRKKKRDGTKDVFPHFTERVSRLTNDIDSHEPDSKYFLMTNVTSFIACLINTRVVQLVSKEAKRKREGEERERGRVQLGSFFDFTHTLFLLPYSARHSSLSYYCKHALQNPFYKIASREFN